MPIKWVVSIQHFVDCRRWLLTTHLIGIFIYMKPNNTQRNLLIVDSYMRTKSIWKTAEEFSVSGQTVANVINKAGVELGRRPFTKDDERFLMDNYKLHVESGRLDELAIKMRRTKPFICRKAGVLGMTDIRRKFIWRPARVRKPYVKKENPKPFTHNVKHTEESKRKMSESRNRNYKSIGAEERTKVALKAVATKMKKYGSMYNDTKPNRVKCTWKAGWREIGGAKYYFRSRWEANYGRYLQFEVESGNILAWEHEPYRFQFPEVEKGRPRTYLPDFRVTNLDGSIAYHEVKGWMDERSKNTLDCMALHYPAIVLILRSAAWFKKNEAEMLRKVTGWESKNMVHQNE
jgi:hypothetical protein